MRGAEKISCNVRAKIVCNLWCFTRMILLFLYDKYTTPRYAFSISYDDLSSKFHQNTGGFPSFFIHFYTPAQKISEESTDFGVIHENF